MRSQAGRAATLLIAALFAPLPSPPTMSGSQSDLAGSACVARWQAVDAGRVVEQAGAQSGRPQCRSQLQRGLLRRRLLQRPARAHARRKSWENNRTRDDVGDAVRRVQRQRVPPHAHQHPEEKSHVLISTDGLAWQPVDWPVPRQVRLVNGVLYSSSYPPTKLARSHDGGRSWESLENEAGWHFKAYAYGPLMGGPPPQIRTK